MLGEGAPAIATRLRAAAGLYKHCAETVLPPLHDALPGERPNELLASMAETMRLVCLAEAQAATARRAEERGAANGLLVKLHLGAHDLYARALCVQRARSRCCWMCCCVIAAVLLGAGGAHALRTAARHRRGG